MTYTNNFLISINSKLHFAVQLSGLNDFLIFKCLIISAFFIYLGFPASLHTDIWTQGRVFVSQYAVYFYSSLFGIGTKVHFIFKKLTGFYLYEILDNYTFEGDYED